MINHGIVTGALFLCIGMIYDRTHSREIAHYGGTASVMPIYAGMFMLFTLASIGLPGTNGFVGEILILLGGFTVSKVLGTLAATGVIIGAAYMLWLYQRIFFESGNDFKSRFGTEIADINAREIFTLLPLLLLVVWIGVYPSTFLDFMVPTVQKLLQRVNDAGIQPGVIQQITEVIK